MSGVYSIGENYHTLDQILVVDKVDKVVLLSIFFSYMVDYMVDKVDKLKVRVELQRRVRTIQNIYMYRVYISSSHRWRF